MDMKDGIYFVSFLYQPPHSERASSFPDRKKESEMVYVKYPESFR